MKKYMSKGIAPIIAIIIGLIVVAGIVGIVAIQKKAPVSEEPLFIPGDEIAERESVIESVEKPTQIDQVGQNFVAGQVYVKIDDNVALDPNVFDILSDYVDISKLPQSIQNVLNQYSVSSVTRPFFKLPGSLQKTIQVGFSSSSSINQFIADLSQLSDVEYAEKIPTITLDTEPVTQQQLLSSCLVIISPVQNQTVSFPLTVMGYIDIAGAQAGTCTRWISFEGEAGHSVVKDTNGNTQSNAVFINTVGDYYVGMQQWPITVIIPSLLGTPYTNQITIHLTGIVVADDDVPPAPQVIGPLTVTPYP